MENYAIPMVLLVQNKFTFTPSENALIIIMNVPRSIRKPRKTSSLLHQVKARYNSYEYSSLYIPGISRPVTLQFLSRKTSSLLHQVKTRS